MNYKSLLYKFIYYSGLNYIYSLFLNRRLFVIMYHSVNSDENNLVLKNNLYKHISINKKNFEEQILYLRKRGHTFINFSDLDHIDLKKIKKPTIVYFDDGFKDVLLNAVPILRKYSIRATIFFVTGILDRTYMLWTILYKEILNRSNIPETDQQSKIEEIKTKNDFDRLEIMKQFDLKNYEYLFDIFMTWNDVLYLHKYDFEIGSHTISHPRLNECSMNDIDREINESKATIEKEIKSPIKSFSFPYGRGNNKIVDRLFQSGYFYIVSSGIGLNKINKKSHYFLKNISPKPNDSLQMFKLKLYFLNAFK